MEFELSDQQLGVLGSDVRLVEACPGAGKTRAIVSRFASAAANSQRGVGLVSFTNTAVNEAISRCSGNPAIISPPNFVGTFDRFLHRFIVTPVFTRKLGKAPRYVNSWSDLKKPWETTVRDRRVPGAGLALSTFRVDAGASLVYPEDVPQVDRAYVSALKSAMLTPRDLTQQAEGMVKRLVAAGIFDADMARVAALQILSNSSYEWIHHRIATRLEELIVDEFQDCSYIEHGILTALENLGIHVVVVADPDQAIYEFRGASPAAYTDYKGRISDEQIVHLQENYRSSPAICKLTTSLRSISDRPIISMRPQSDIAPHSEFVYVVAGDHEFARTQFDALASKLNILPQDRLVLAATRKGAAELSGQVNIDNSATKLTARILGDVAMLQPGFGNAAARKDALESIESAILGTVKFGTDLAQAPKADQLDAAGLEPSELRMIVPKLVKASTDWNSPETAVNSIRNVVKDSLAGVKLPVTSMAVRFKTLDSRDWKRWIKSTDRSGDVTGLPSAHIHSVKGCEFDAVMLEIEDDKKGDRDHIIELWNSNETSEAKRVLYVGASRARRLLVLATPPRHLAALRELLDGKNLPVQYIEAEIR